MQVALTELSLIDDTCQGRHVAMLDVHEVKVTTRSTTAAVTVDGSLQSLNIHDMYSQGPGVSQLLMSRHTASMRLACSYLQ